MAVKVEIIQFSGEELADGPTIALKFSQSVPVPRYFHRGWLRSIPEDPNSVQTETNSHLIDQVQID